MRTKPEFVHVQLDLRAAVLLLCRAAAAPAAAAAAERPPPPPVVRVAATLAPPAAGAEGWEPLQVTVLGEGGVRRSPTLGELAGASPVDKVAALVKQELGAKN